MCFNGAFLRAGGGDSLYFLLGIFLSALAEAPAWSRMRTSGGLFFYDDQVSVAEHAAANLFNIRRIKIISRHLT